MDIAPGPVLGVENAQVGGLGQVGPGQVGRATDGFGQHRIDRGQHHFRRLAGRDLGFVGAGLALEIGDGGGKGRVRLARHAGGKGIAPVLRQGVHPRCPCLAQGGAAAADLAPAGDQIVRQFEIAVFPRIGQPCRLDLVGAKRRAVDPRGAALLFRAVADGGAAGDQHGAAVVLFRGGQGAVDVGGVMAVADQRAPARRLEPPDLVGGVRQRDLAVDGDAVVVPQHDKPSQAQMTGQGDRLLADAFHQAAVAGDDPGAVVAQFLAELGAHLGLGDGKADRGCQPLTQGAGGHLDPLGMAVFGMAGRDGAPLAEVPDLVQRHLFKAGQMQQRIDQHRPVSRRQDEAVAVEPVGGARVELEMFAPQDRGDIGHAHRHPRMARIGGLDRIHRQRADGAGEAPVVGIGKTGFGQGHRMDPRDGTGGLLG